MSVKAIWRLALVLFSYLYSMESKAGIVKWAIVCLVENYHDGTTNKRNQFLAKYLGKFDSDSSLLLKRSRSIDVLFLARKCSMHTRSKYVNTNFKTFLQLQ